MSRVVEFFVPGNPVAQQRAKTRGRKTAGGGYKVTGKYDPEECVSFKNRVAGTAHAKVRECWGPDVPLIVEMTFYLPRPQSVSIKKRPFPVKKPDWDNFGKGPSDAMESIVYSNDSQIVTCTINKEYADIGQPVGVAVRIWRRVG